MLIDVQKEPPKEGHIFKSRVCIIGGGAAGLTITRELAKFGIDVITLEGGGLKETKRSQNIYRGENEGRKYFKLHRSRRRFLGGSTNCWAGLCAPLRPTDFEKRSWIPHSGWPINFEEIGPHYARAGELLKIGSFHPELDQPRREGQHLSGPGLRLDGFESVYFQMSPPVRLGKLWRDDLAALDKAQVLINANVTHLQLRESATSMNAVSCKVFDGPSFTVEADYFVLACGGIENPRMLLNARDIAKTGIGNQHDLVGRYFMEHPHIDRESLWVPGGATPSLSHYHRRKSRGVKGRIWPYLRPSASRLAQEELLDFSLVLFQRKNIEREEERHPLLQVVFESSEHLHDPSKKARGIRAYTFGNPMEQAPDPSSRVSLDEDGERDELGLIKSTLNWRLSPLEKRTLRRAHEMIAESLAARDYGRVRVTPTHNLDLFPKQTKGGYHHMGTTRMAHTEREGVVDRDSKVFGVDNLFIAGSSVFTTSGSANPTLTIVALALRLAEHIKTLSKSER
jgi:choline dehydrogenase-like flavoprotein